ncbi:LacI family DNA-binding transcriptional regulator [Streptomyces paludis]|uniref:LacI family transcriptional regulator n=1 Tax=Streptomyces paludis TaxID=2282738 RepID=A0A345HUD7_9ACTN|nr:LacI family DNA-binding transcriptional regulator [Streptomyces paludis]AXG80311.1 LacI family transcriptional regulator [Streptomyces paludis]
MATLKDVARVAGVSVMSVSNVLNGTGRFSPEMRERVHRAAERVGYAGPDPAAASLRRKRTGTLGVVLPLPLEMAFADPAATAFLQGVSREFHRRETGLTLLALPHAAGPLERHAAAPAERVARAPLAALERAVIDAALLYSVEEDHPGLDILARRALPVLAVDSPGPDNGLAHFGAAWGGFVTVDDHGGALAAARHLTALGHRRAVILVDRLTAQPRLGPVGWPEALATTSAVVRRRLTGYRDAWTEAGLPLGDLGVVECGSVDADAGHTACHQVLSGPGPRPTALLAVADTLAIGASRAARAYGLTLPGQLSVVGYDDIPAAATEPLPLTTVHQPTVEKGETAARLLLDRTHPAPAGPGAAATATDEPCRRELPTRLVVRASAARPAAG